MVKGRKAASLQRAITATFGHHMIVNGSSLTVQAFKFCHDSFGLKMRRILPFRELYSGKTPSSRDCNTVHTVFQKLVGSFQPPVYNLDRPIAIIGCSTSPIRLPTLIQI